MTNRKKPRKRSTPTPLVVFNKTIGEKDAAKVLARILDEDTRTQQQIADLAKVTTRTLQNARDGKSPTQTVVDILRHMGYTVEVSISIETPEE